VTGPVIRLSQVGKQYTKYDDTALVGGGLRFRTRSRRSVLDAVQALDLEVEQGGSVGVLGRTGAGKSTLLQMLCGVTAPTTGRVEVRGRVAPLISVGVGFHPELTGRENVYVNGTVLGMTRAEIDRRFDDIVAFSEIESFIDTPVKFYSSGMFVRLGFSVAVAADPDVLLVDEVLAVGDFAFQMKCFRRMEEIRSQGTTIVVISHNVTAIRGLCQRGIVMQRGRKVFDGGVNDAVASYYASVGQLPDDEQQGGSGVAATVEELELIGPDGPTTHVRTGDEATFRLRVRALRDVPQPVVGISVSSESGVLVSSDSNRDAPFAPLRAGELATYELPFTVRLATGGFVATSALHERSGSDHVVRLTSPATVSFYVAGRPLVSGTHDLGGTMRQVEADG
jgi:ABC-2 type transport system ATP-binding protein